MPSLPVICVFGAKDIKLMSPECAPFEARDMDLRHYQTDEKLYEILAKECPSTIASFGDKSSFKMLLDAPSFVKKMWIHFDNTDGLADKGSKVFDHFFLNVILPNAEKPLVSVFTPAFRSGDKIEKPFRSLLSQTYKDWEWVIVDDSDDNGETFRNLSALAERDGRIRVYKEHKHSGRIGTVKRTACGLARGSFLVELDHDDELTPNALKWTVEAFQAHPEAGFVYTDFAECFEDGSPVTYPAGWGMGYGSYREEIHGGIKYMVANSPHINSKTIRHIVAAPNHIRAWRKKTYDEIGGHRDMMHVADDYELVVRTFLATRMIRIPKMCYVQYRNLDGSGNTHKTRNMDIQRLVRYISMAYNEAIHKRFLELGVNDFAWHGDGTFYRLLQTPNIPVESHCTILYTPKACKSISQG